MIPVTSVIATAAGIALGTPAGTDSQWGSPALGTSVVSLPCLSPGGQADDATQHRAWKQLWIENGTDARLDVGVLTTPGKIVVDVSVLNSEVKTTIISIAAGGFATWDFSPDRLAGPIFLRGTTADPTTGNAYLGGIAE